MEKEQEKMILSHEPVAGYRTALFIVLAVGVLYLAVVFGRTLF
jgi:hypothetical protein